MPRQVSVFDQLSGDRVHFAMQFGKVLVADGFAVDADALVDSNQVRRGIQPGFQS